MTDTAPQWFVGVDWARETHQVCVLDAAGVMLGERAFAHGGAGLADLCDWVLATTGAEAGAIAVAVEVPHGPVVETLLERGFQVYAVNPKQLDRFRDRFTVAGAKDDRRDGHVLGDSLRTDRHCFRSLSIANPVVVELREWSRMAEDLQQERTRLANRVREQLWRYYPQSPAATSPPIGFSICGAWRRRRRRQPGSARAASIGCSRRIASAGSMPRKPLAGCVRSR